MRGTRWVLLMLVAAAQCHIAAAQPYPAKPVRVVVPYPAGGPLDDVMRFVGQRLTELWGQSVIVDNRSGAGGSIGADVVAKSAPDGYTLLLGNAGPLTVNPGLHKKLPYDPQKDLVPVTLMVSGMMVLSVHPSLPVKSVKELVALARARPGQLNYGSAGIGNLTHLGMELLQSMARIRMTHVPYKGASPAFVDLMAGQIEVMFANIAGTVPYVRSGRVRAIAVSAARRSDALPEVPSVAETYPGFDLVTWMGIFVPAATPGAIRASVHGGLVKVLRRQDVGERLAALGTGVVAGTADELGALVARELELYARIIRSAGILPQ